MIRRAATAVAHHTRRTAHGTSRLITALVSALGEVLGSLARLTVIAVFVITFLLQPSQIPSGSMEHTLLVGDFVLVNKQAFAPPGHFRFLLPYRDPRADDIIVFHYPVTPDEILVKRAVALPGDNIHLESGHLVRNGTLQSEPFAHYTYAAPSPFRDNFPDQTHDDLSVDAHWWVDLRRRLRPDAANPGDLRVPPVAYFALGDNRNNSQDSRYWGFVGRSAIIGEPLLVYLSVDSEAPPHHRIRWSRTLRVVR